ncbi:hypothetical protein [Mycolicibacterium neoaurum]|uniref:hypothetical protein n=1 Tax=Mycolicibacterium neoaurum TaxID=1795 RepID=UPI001F4C5FDB|nr:hypothetical protein [Mycolicibacterium neoaurum]
MTQHRSPEDLPASYSGSVVTALTTATAAAEGAVKRAQAVADQILGLSVLSLRQQRYNDRFIADRLHVSAECIRDAPRRVSMLMGPEEEQLRADVKQRWDQAREALAWVQEEQVQFSRDIVGRYRIDISTSQPLTVHALDLPAAEFVNSESGERFLVYSLQRWKGVPTRTPGVWSGQGSFTLDLLTPAGERMTVPAQDWLGLDPAATEFTSDAGNSGSDEAFDRVVVAFRRTYGALPPHLEAASLQLTYRHPQ